MISIKPNFVTVEEEQQLLSHVKPSRVVTGKERNRIIRYGSKLPYNSHIKGDIPKWMHEICFRVAKELGGVLPDSVSINEYCKGQFIDWHIDSPSSGDVITVLSLESDAVMGLKAQKEEIGLSLPARSLLIMSGEDRWDKKHCIYPVDNHRWSIVFRKGT